MNPATISVEATAEPLVKSNYLIHLAGLWNAPVDVSLTRPFHITGGPVRVVPSTPNVVQMPAYRREGVRVETTTEWPA
jgi:hypothetical protein